jgi:AraC-like DNA-binding protein
VDRAYILLTAAPHSYFIYIMFYRDYVPPPPLSDFVDRIWFSEGYVAAHKRERVLPNGSMALVINLREDRFRIYDGENHNRFEAFSGSIVCGTRSEPVVIDSPEDASLMGVHFKTGGGFPFFKFPASELCNTQVALDTLLGARSGWLREQLMEATTPESRFAIVERWLSAQAPGRLVRHQAVKYALGQFSGSRARTVGEVTEEIGMSARRFIQVFAEEVGLTPKLFCRVQRFQNVIQSIDRQRGVDWAATASAYGYFDQAHFIHDFKALAGLNPTDYLINCGQYPNHVAIRD